MSNLLLSTKFASHLERFQHSDNVMPTPALYRYSMWLRVAMADNM